MGTTYKKAGVDIHKAARFKQKIKPLLRASFSKDVLKDIGGFGAFFRLNKTRCKNPILVSSADGVGTKLKIAALAGKHDTVGIDLVAMNVNDILCAGATPLFFLDYIASSSLTPRVLYDIVKGINDGCIEAGCALIGGETAQMPDMYKKDEYDLAGFCTGVVEQNEIIDGSRIAPGDVVIGLESNGIHSNGYSLVRKVLSEKEQLSMAKELLKPTRIYVKPVLSAVRALRREIKGISHITGGAFYDKITRILPEGITARIYKNAWMVPDIFSLIQKKGAIGDREMYHTFNMGIGMVLISSRDAVNAIKIELAKNGVRSMRIGEVEKGKRETIVM